MTIDRIAFNKVLVTLCSKEMEDFSLDFDKLSLNDYHSRKILMRILHLACFKSGIEINNKNILMEALPYFGGCSILLTVTEKAGRKTYRIKRNKSICFRLGDSKNFLDTIEVLYHQNVCCNKNSVYIYNNEYYLIFDYTNIPKKLRIVLSEYAMYFSSNIEAARIKEYGKLICEKNAIERIGKWL